MTIVFSSMSEYIPRQVSINHQISAFAKSLVLFLLDDCYEVFEPSGYDQRAGM